MISCHSQFPLRESAGASFPTSVISNPRKWAKKKKGKIEFCSLQEQLWEGRRKTPKKPLDFADFFFFFKDKKISKKIPISAQGFGFNSTLGLLLLREGKFGIKWNWEWGEETFLGNVEEPGVHSCLCQWKSGINPIRVASWISRKFPHGILLFSQYFPQTWCFSHPFLQKTSSQTPFFPPVFQDILGFFCNTQKKKKKIWETWV